MLLLSSHHCDEPKPSVLGLDRFLTENILELHVLFYMSHVSPITTLWSISDSGNYKSRTERPQSVAFYQGKKK